jgi:hypothetical protein
LPELSPLCTLLRWDESDVDARRAWGCGAFIGEVALAVDDDRDEDLPILEFPSFGLFTVADLPYDQLPRRPPPLTTVP